MTAWAHQRFGDLCDVTRGASPRPIHDYYAPTGIPWIKISDATASASRFIHRTAEFIRPEGEARSVSVAPGDLILSNSATPGIPRFVNLRACIHDGWLLLRNFRGIDKQFAYYALEVARPYLLRQGNGSVFTNLKTEILKEYRLPLPPLGEQARIAAILGALDDKIELNRRMNQTLEEMTQAIFKSWFIDFDGHDDLVDSEMGPVPRGWELTPIGSAVRVVGGSTPSTKEPAYWSGGRHSWATPKDLSGLAVPVLLATERRITDAGLGCISSGLLPAGTFLLSSRAPIGYTAIAHMPVAINQGFIAVPPGGALPPAFLLFWTRFNMESIKGRAGGTTFPEISKSAFRPILVAVPPAPRLAEFGRTVDPLLARIAANARESATLTTLRDTLLPKLISGELRVPDAEAAVSEAL